VTPCLCTWADECIRCRDEAEAAALAERDAQEDAVERAAAPRQGLAEDMADDYAADAWRMGL
jgi:hypothetical protein